ncbi:MAG: PASTA domain-containing protein [Bacteroidales bacterium]|nr:PASTA domain-containing protein [Bacteroidales bacterium]
MNIFLAIAVLGALLIATLLSLKTFTRHGEEILLPDFEGESIVSLQSFVKENNLRYAIIDSVYNDDLTPGTIVLQDPYPHSKVKKGRKIYVSVVSSLPESVIMPNVVNLSVRQAVSLIYGNDLTIDKLIFRSGFDKNSVQEQLVDDETVEGGAKLKKFTPVTLIVSAGNRASFTKTPDIVGLTKDEAIQRIYQHSFNVGTILGNNVNLTGLKVVSQAPKSSNINTYPLGYKINFKLSNDPKDVDTTKSFDYSYQSGIDTSLMIYMQEDIYEDEFIEEEVEGESNDDFILDEETDDGSFDQNTIENDFFEEEF